MKRILLILLTLSIFTTSIFAQEEQGDIYDDGYVYEQNGRGDRFLKMNIGGLFPLNFDKQLYVGGAADLGFYYFLNKWIAIGGEFTATYNISIGHKILIMMPITFGVIAQPYTGKFEFPISLNAGVGYQTWQSIDYFPSFVLKASAGAYYRLNESWSFGLSSSFMWMPQRFKDKSKNDDALFLNACIGARYLF